MLHAFAHNKSRAFTRYLRIREESEPRVSSEDEITSLIFGPLEFLSAVDNWTLWKLLLRGHASMDMSGPLPGNFFDNFSPESCTLVFWPRKDNIEPDLLVEFSNVEGDTRALLVELKWDSPESGEDQLEKQWLRYQSGQHAHSLHVFVAKRIVPRPTDLLRPWSCTDTGHPAASRLRALRWHDIMHTVARLAAMPATSAPLRRWCVLAGGFLRQVGIRPFVGFHAVVAMAESILDSDDNAIRFWQRHQPMGVIKQETVS